MQPDYKDDKLWGKLNGITFLCALDQDDCHCPKGSLVSMNLKNKIIPNKFVDSKQIEAESNEPTSCSKDFFFEGASAFKDPKYFLDTKCFC